MYLLIAFQSDYEDSEEKMDTVEDCDDDAPMLLTKKEISMKVNE